MHVVSNFALYVQWLVNLCRAVLAPCALHMMASIELCHVLVIRGNLSSSCVVVAYMSYDLTLFLAARNPLILFSVYSSIWLRVTSLRVSPAGPDVNTPPLGASIMS